MRVSLLLALAPLSAPAYPIPPQTLWELTARAEQVVLARVDRVEFSEEGDRATLEVLETWKGQPSRQAQVHFRAGVVCPAPPTFKEGARVVAFLRSHEGALRVTGLSYGTRYPVDSREEQELRFLTGEALRHQGGKEMEEVAPAPEEWALKAVGTLAGRWDGLYSLQSAADPAHRYYDRKREDRTLGPQALDAVEAAFVAAPSVDSTLPMMLRLLERRGSARVDQAAVDAIEAVLQAQSASYWLEEAVGSLQVRLGGGPSERPAQQDPLLTRVRTRFDEGPEQREDRVQARWEGLKRQFKLVPSKDRAMEPVRRIPVGGDSTL